MTGLPGRTGVTAAPAGSSPLVLATRNPGKLVELCRLLAGRGLQLMDLDEARFDGELVEPGASYEDNAGAKALAVCRGTGLPALADDSGIEIVALQGWPGPLSARWLGGSDADRLRGLLDAVARRTPDDRRARYVAVAALARPGHDAVSLAWGSCRGVLLAEPRGTRGFGYDPAFLSQDLDRTFAEATAEEKDSCSHRARAVARLAETGLLDGIAAR